MSHAKGRYALGECAKSGKVLPLHELVRDGYYKGLMVAPEWYEPPSPYEHLKDIDDPIALENPAPRRDAIGAYVTFPLFDVSNNQFGVDLFMVIGCMAQAIDQTKLMVALYDSEPANQYNTDGECNMPGYTAGGVPIGAVVNGSSIEFDQARWNNVTGNALWALIYDSAAGDGLLKTKFGGLVECVNAAFVIDWTGMQYIVDTSGKCIDRIK